MRALAKALCVYLPDAVSQRHVRGRVLGVIALDVRDVVEAVDFIDSATVRDILQKEDHSDTRRMKVSSKPQETITKASLPPPTATTKHFLK